MMSMQGFTFERPSDTKYSEHYIYQQSFDDKINYDMFLFRDPGLKRVIRHKAHQWGVQNLLKLIEIQQKLQLKKQEAFAMATQKTEELKQSADRAATKIKHHGQQTLEQVEDHFEHAKSKVMQKFNKKND